MAVSFWTAGISRRLTLLALLAFAHPADAAPRHHTAPTPSAPDQIISTVPATSAVMLDAIPPEALPLASGGLNVGTRATAPREFRT